MPLGIDAVSITCGFWAERQGVNAAATLKHCLGWVPVAHIRGVHRIEDLGPDIAGLVLSWDGRPRVLTARPSADPGK